MILQDKVALMTGGASAIGRATARYLLAIAFLNHSNAWPWSIDHSLERCRSRLQVINGKEANEQY